MDTLQRWGVYAYRAALAALALYGLYQFARGDMLSLFDGVMYFLPATGMILTLSAEADLLAKVQHGETVSIRARGLNLIHWLMLTFMFVGRWAAGGITGWASILNVLLVALIGCQVGYGIGRQWFPTKNERFAGAIMFACAAILGLAAGWVRTLDGTAFGWGWALETSTAVVATGIVMWWIAQDIITISRDASGYPRAYFLKGVASSLPLVLVLAHLVRIYPGGVGEALAANAGFAFNIVVGNAIFLAFYATWEVHHARQSRHIAA